MAESKENLEQVLATIIGSAKRAIESGAKVKQAFQKRIHGLIVSLTERLEGLEFCSELILGSNLRQYEWDTLAPLIVSRLDRLLPRMSHEPAPDITREGIALLELKASEKEVSWMLALLCLLYLYSTGMSLLPLQSSGERSDDDISFFLSGLGLDKVLTADGRVEVKLLLNLLIEGTVPHKLIADMALGGLVQRKSMKVEQLVEAEVVVVFGKILIEGPMPVRAEVAHVIYQLMANNPTIPDKLALHDLIGSLVNLLKSNAVEDDRNQKSETGGQVQLQWETSPNVKARMRAMATDTLPVLAKDVASFCRITIEISTLLQDKSMDVRLSSVKALVEVTAVVERDADLRRSAFKHNPHAEKIVANQLITIIEESMVSSDIQQSGPRMPSSPEILIACIRVIGHLATTFQETRPLITLVHLLGSRNYEVCDVTLCALTKFARRVDLSLSDHSEAIEGNPGVYHWHFWLCCLGFAEELQLESEFKAMLLESQYQVNSLLAYLREGTILDKLIATVTIGAIAEQSTKVKKLVEAGLVVAFGKILIEGPPLIGAEVAYVISKLVEIDPRLRAKLALHDLIGSLVSLLQVEAVEEHSQDDINKATSVLSIVIARHNSNRRKVDDDRSEKSMSGKQIQLPRETSPDVTTRARAMAAKALRVLAKDNAAVCRIIVQKNALFCFGVLLQDRNLDVKLSSAEALMEITMVAEKDTDLRRSTFRHNLRASKTVVDQLIRITEESVSSPELLIPCIRAIGNLATTFRETRPVIPLVRLLGSGNHEVCEETLIALTKFACRENFLHLDHSKAILGLPEVDHLVYLAKGAPFCFQGEVQKLSLVLLCYIALDAPGSLSYKRKEVVSAIELASREVRFSKDESEQAHLVKEAKRRLG